MLTIKTGPLRVALAEAYRSNEDQAVENLIAFAKLPASLLEKAQQTATSLVLGVRERRIGKGGIDAFLAQYNLSSQEGIALMCIAESMLRIPDNATIDLLIKDKLTNADWQSYVGKSDSLFVNAATWSLMLTGKIITDHDEHQQSLKTVLMSLAKRGSEPVIRTAVGHAMRILGKQFVMGRNIQEALQRARVSEQQGYRYSYDMLGEAARTADDAVRYFKAYSNAIHAIGKAAKGRNYITAPGVSVKLSALHPRYEFAKREQVVADLVPKVLELACLAKQYDIGFTIDAEEAKRLELSLDIIENVFADPALENWQGFGLAIQAYQKRCFYLIDWLVELAKQHQKKFMLRLVKGAYWDSEIKQSQVEGLDGYPVFTRKANTDVSYIACAKKMLQYPEQIYAQFATHNAYSVAVIMELAGERTDYEFQCLHGMGQVLYNQIVGSKHFNIPCRIYAPVGSHKELLPYLVRRLLENGANTSFVNRIVDANLPIAELIADPVAHMETITPKAHPHIPLPRNLYGNERLNSQGLDLSNRVVLTEFEQQLEKFSGKIWQAKPTLAKELTEGKSVLSPTDLSIVGHASQASEIDLEQALHQAQAAQPAWQKKSMPERATVLRKAADLLEQHEIEFYALAIREAGKTINDAIAEVREAVDFCRYYAEQAEKLPNGAQALGVVLCISPWNFPLAIFLGQVAAALVVGNAVLAKPAEQTPLIAARAMELLHQAGVPEAVAQLIPGRGSVIGAKLVSNPLVRAIMFTGSTETAQVINQSLAARGGYDVPFIAETGGQNAMIVDSSALPEQVVDDAITSAFGSAGQRCSALRVLFVQEDIADNIIHMLRGAMEQLQLGDPKNLITDIGPVIDAAAQQMLQQHAEQMKIEGKLIAQVPVPTTLTGYFFTPTAVEIANLSLLPREVFGPILHVIRYKASQLDDVLQQIKTTGYGLTMGIHSRIEQTVRHIRQHSAVGNTYVNRNMIGAVVGVQPFGGEGLSGTGPKAGGPHYLRRLCQLPNTWQTIAEDEQSTTQDEIVIAPALSIAQALQQAKQILPEWNRVTIQERLKIVSKVSEIFLQNREKFISCASPEKFQQALNVLEFYRHEAELQLVTPKIMPGPTGESNQLESHPRGLVLIIGEHWSSSSVALAQIGSALLAGNRVIVQPTVQTVSKAVVLAECFYQAGLSKAVLQILPASDQGISDNLLSAPEVDAVMFIGDRAIAKKLSSN